MTVRERLFEYVKEKYDTDPEHLWARYPNYAVFRHGGSGKWFGIIMDVRRDRLGIGGEGKADVLNIKLWDPLLSYLLLQRQGYAKAYHMSRGSWISVLLDGTVPFEEITGLLGESYAAAAPGEKKSKPRPPKEWLIPANPKYYDIAAAFDKADIIEWKQGAGIRKGDTVYMYVAAPVSAIMYRCRVAETDIPYEYDNGSVRMKALMKIELERRYPPDRFTFDILGREYGVYAVRGPRGLPHGLSEALKLK